MKILVTGAAGFIGMHVSEKLLARGDEVICIDNLSDYYDVSLKLARLERLNFYPNYQFHQVDISDQMAMRELFKSIKPERVINLAAQAGVRHSISHPQAYMDANLQGFINVLEGCRHNEIEHLTYASSSSVYGSNSTLPFTENQNIDHPLSLYAATKKANELMAHTYSHLFGLPTTGLRFFTAYGPWGRPDMALFLFAKAILEDRPIDVFNHGKMTRDFTYIDDIARAVIAVSDKIATPSAVFNTTTPDPSTSNAPYRIFNVGNSQPTSLMDYIHALEHALNKEAKKNFLPMQVGDVPNTAANTTELENWICFKPATSVKDGVNAFVGWYRSYYKV
jgi:UDP-glucuronate 4-epimerase